MKIEWDIHKEDKNIHYFCDYKNKQIMIVKYIHGIPSLKNNYWYLLYDNEGSFNDHGCPVSLGYLPQTEEELELLLVYI